MRKVCQHVGCIDDLTLDAAVCRFGEAAERDWSVERRRMPRHALSRCPREVKTAEADVGSLDLVDDRERMHICVPRRFTPRLESSAEGALPSVPKRRVA